MKILFSFVLAFLANEIQAQQRHLVAWQSHPVHIPFDGRTTNRGHWECDPGPCDVEFNHPRRSQANATFYCQGIYNCHFTEAHTFGSAVTAQVTVQVEFHDELPLMRLSGALFNELLHLRYHYLALSHRFLSHHRYLPKISKFFKGLMDTAAETSDTVAKYVLAKYITTSATDGSNPPNYVNELFNIGFAPDLSYDPLAPTGSLLQGFQQAFELEKQVVSTLTGIASLAENLGDGELEEFVVADLIPPMLKRLKMLSNHVYTVKGITEKDAPLGEFIYDREL